MGYTHRYTINDLGQDLHTKEIARDIRAVTKASGLSIGDYQGTPTSQPTLGPTEIRFNGIGKEGAETFVFPPDSTTNSLLGLPPNRHFCKTYRRPYDIIVCAALIAIQHHLRDNVEVRSDGNFDREEEWQNAYRLYRKALKRELPPPFKQAETTAPETTAPETTEAETTRAEPHQRSIPPSTSPAQLSMNI